MNGIYWFLPTLAGDFDVLNANRGPGVYYTLWRKLSETGAGAYYIERRIGIWMIIISVGLLFLSWAYKASHVQERNHLKQRTIIAIVVIAIFFGLAGLITTAIGIGFDN